MRSAQLLPGGPSFGVAEVSCDAPRGPLARAEATSRFALVLPRRGRFSRRVDGLDYLVDATTGYFELPGQEQRVGHPCEGGDLCTVVTLAPDLVASVRDHRDVPAGPLPPSPRLALSHRLLLAACRRGDVPAASDHAVALLSAAASTTDGASSRVAARHHRRLVVERATEALAHDTTLTLPELGAVAGCSPHHLSRAFPEVVGCSVTAYRTYVRLTRVLDRLAEGAESLALVAAEAGFADHAHLTRVAKRHLGQVPSSLRKALSPDLT